MDNTCSEIRDLIALGAGGETADNERIAIEAHVSVCSECARELAQARTMVGNLAMLRDGEMPPGAAERIWRGVESAVPGRRQSVFLRWTVRAAAVLVMGLAVGYTSASLARGSADPNSAAVEETIDDVPSTLVKQPVTRAFGRKSAPEQQPQPPGVSFFHVLPSSTHHFLPSVEAVLESDEFRF